MLTVDERLQIALTLLDERGMRRYIDNCHRVKLSSYIFLSPDGTTLDGAGEGVDNNQHIGFGHGLAALDAYNDMLHSHKFVGNFDTCFAYRLANRQCAGNFDIIQDTSIGGSSE